VDYRSAMPTNLYGPGDNCHPQNSHVIPALVRRFHEAKLAGSPEVVVWGSGTPRRELLYVEDMADGCIFLLEQPEEALAGELFSYPKPCFVNLGTGIDVTIRELAETVQDVVGYRGQLVFDPSKPDGTPRKLQDVTRMTALGWQAQTPLRVGIERTYRWFMENEGRFRS
jgi:GDP-L-fucose synthase